MLGTSRFRILNCVPRWPTLRRAIGRGSRVLLGVVLLLTPCIPVTAQTPLSSNQEGALKPGDMFQECDDCPEMVVVPAGEFTMGTTDDEPGPIFSPQHQVKLSRPFAVGEFAVTFREWDACTADGGCNGYRPDDGGWGRGRQPALLLSWHDAKAYVAWLSRKTGKTYRLLSEAEREYVTRAGTNTPFWWGAEITSAQANYDTTYLYDAGFFRWLFSRREPWRQRTVPVDSFAPNPWGLYQVHGNVWDWVEDCENPNYLGAPTDGSAWTDPSCRQHILRGGSWLDQPNSLRADFRWSEEPYERTWMFGMRVARTL
jgi:formylglycine-generating enzyme required for sulfatase activity